MNDYQPLNRRAEMPIEFVRATYADSRRRSIMRHNESVLRDARRRLRRERIARWMLGS